MMVADSDVLSDVLESRLPGSRHGDCRAVRSLTPPGSSRGIEGERVRAAFVRQPVVSDNSSHAQAQAARW
jgi:hypothetical protein